ncbi:hypothetical protein [Streptomyces sp. NPDC051561]|uniref:hypothetical protein n=1 Tax=Streptomyces sp. NPDC051561 TaxID=3365658 RepID=UPI003796737C
MSKTTHPAPRPLRAIPEPATAAEPLSGLTGAPATLFTELTALTEPATTAALALAAGLGRSTAGKALVTLEEHGLATRIPGGHDGARRTPDRWQPAPTPATAEPLVAETAVPPAALPEASSALDSDENADAAPPAPGTGSNASESPAPESSTSTPTETPDTAHAAPPPGSEASEAPPAGPTTGPAAVQADTSVPGPASPAPPAASAPVMPEPAPPAVPTGGKRLAPGGLRQMVIDHLTAHPDEAFTATGISRVIDRSSGAIANALVTLTKQGFAEQVSERPRTYRHTTPGSSQ